MKALYNLRPYSWIDLILIGLLAKGSFGLEQTDLLVAISLLGLWFFYQFMLEKKHAYSYRGGFRAVPAVLSIALPLIISVLTNPASVAWIIISTMLVIVYLQKNRSALLGCLSSPVRGLIQLAYFLYAASIYSVTVPFILCFIVFVLYTVRAIIGDIRDYRHNRKAKKATLVVKFGVRKGIVIAESLLLIAVLSLGSISFWAAAPASLFGLALLFYRNGYVLHQLMIMTTSFTWIALITTEPILTSLIYLGICLNMIFYPLLARKSNPR